MRVLYIEDNSRDADLARRELGRHAAYIKLDVASTLKEAHARLISEPTYDLVLADLRLPDGSGMDMLSHIRKHSLPLAVVILTGKGDEQAAVAALKSGADDYIIKTKDYFTRLPLALENALGRFRGEAARKVQPLRVLYAEHNATDIDLTLRHMAQYAPFIHIDVIHTAVEIFKRLPLADSEQKPYDVLLMDFRLPGLNALETVKRLREERRLSLPVVFVTGQGDEEVAVQALRLGVDDYLTKGLGYLFRLPAALENSAYRAQLAREQAALREKTDELDRYFNEALDLLCIADTDGYFRRLNKEWESALGYKLSDLEGRRFLDFVHPDDLKPTLEALSSLKDQKEVLNFVSRYRCKDGSYKWIEWRSYPSGKLIYAVARDITDRKRAEEALRFSERKFAAAFQASPDAITITSAKDGRIIEANEMTFRLTGYTREELIGHSTIELNFWADESARERYVALLREHARVVEMEAGFRIKSGEIRCVLVSGEGITVEGQPHILGIIRDITERKRVEARLAYQASLLENVNDAVISSDEKSIITSWNKAAERIFGWKAEEALGRDGQELLRNDYESIEPSEITRQLNEIGSFRGEIIQYHKDGAPVSIETNIMALKDEQGRTTGFIGVNRDITERKRADAALRESEEKFRNLVETISDVIFAIDENAVITYVSPVVKGLFGYAPHELIGRNFMEFVLKDDQSILMNRLLDLRRGGISQSTDFRLISKGGEVRWARTRTNPFIEGGAFKGVRGALLDIHDRKQAEERLLETLERLRIAVRTTIQVLVMTVEARDPYTAGHQLRTTALATAIAAEMGLPHDIIEGVHQAGQIHDIGKISIPSDLLSKPTKLTKIEFDLVKTHAQEGYEILKNVESPWPLAEIVYQHHERTDGSGYPRGLKGGEMLLEARIMAVADTVEAMASHRPYRPALGIDAALAEIENNKGVLYDPDVAAACLRLFREKDFSFKKT
jgi:PAS domain S-box-containing protein